LKSFIHEDFLLDNEASRVLYHQYAKDKPIYDFHCHISPKEIAENKAFTNLTEIWLAGDHYKWRAMRSLGIDESFITGNADDREKFQIWAKSVPETLGNPLYHWTHLELKRYFGVEVLLNQETSDQVWNHCNSLLQKGDFTTQKIIEKSNVKVICTTDDPIDDLQYHQAIKQNQSITTKVLPAFRPDKAIEISGPNFNEYVTKLADAASIEINTYENLLAALENRAYYFDEVGCRVSDHGIEIVPFEECTFEEASAIFKKVKDGGEITKNEETKYKTFTLLFLGEMYRSLEWVMQLHIGAIRNNNKRMFAELGPDTGFDSISDFELAKPLNQFLNELDKDNQLPKMIIYNLNPIHNDVIASAAGNFQSSETKGKIQLGSGWWFNDQKDGMLKQMTSLSNIGLLSSFVGMLTDSRSFLSYTRHEYFRRVLCGLIGGWVESGEAPRDYKLLGKIVQDISYNNAEAYFEIK
jgi:glucuronate isomerase